MNLGQEWSHDPSVPLDSEEQLLIDYFDGSIESAEGDGIGSKIQEIVA